MYGWMFFLVSYNKGNLNVEQYIVLKALKQIYKE